MALNTFSAGVNTSFSSELNANSGEFIALAAKTFREAGIAGNYGDDFRDEADFTTYNELDGATIASSDGWYNSTLGLYFLGYNYDDYDSSLDTTKWAGSGDGSNSENTVSAERAYAATQSSPRSLSFEAKGSSDSANIYPSSGTTSEGCIQFAMRANHPTNNATDTVTWYLSDGSTDVQLNQDTTTTSNAVLNGTHFFSLDIGTDTFSWYNTYGGSSTDIDVSSLTGTEWFFKGTATTNGNGGSSATNMYVRFNSIVYTNGGETIPTSSFISTATTTNNSNSKALDTYYGESIAVSLSTNGGSNYTVGANKTIVSTTAGTSFQVKVEPSSSTPNTLPKFTELVAQSLE